MNRAASQHSTSLEKPVSSHAELLVKLESSHINVRASENTKVMNGSWMDTDCAVPALTTVLLKLLAIQID